MPTNITHKQFLSISRDIKAHLREHSYEAAKLAKAHGVSEGTIRRIRNAKTWNGFLALKASRQTSPKQSPVEKELATAIETLQQPDDERRKLFEKNFEVELARLKQYPTREETTKEISYIHSRQDGLLVRVKELEDNQPSGLLPVLAVLASITALLVAIWS
jgi:transposase